MKDKTKKIKIIAYLIIGMPLIGMCIILIALLLPINLFQPKDYNSLNKYLKNWESEVNMNILEDQLGKFKYNDKIINLYEINNYFKEALVVYNNELYFSSFSYDLNEGYFEIQSFNLKNEKITTHQKFNLNFNKYERSKYCYLSKITSNQKENYGVYGCLVINHKIYISLIDKFYTFDYVQNELLEIDSFSLSKYEINITNNRQTLEIINDKNVKKTIDLNIMADKNKYAKKIYDLSFKKKIFSGYKYENLVSNLYAYVKIINNEIYIVCNITDNKNNNSAVVFKYDFDLEQILFVTTYYTHGSVDTYNFVIIDE